MEMKTATPESRCNLEHTSSGNPFIKVTTSSATPIYLTELYLTDVPAMVATLNLPEISRVLISIPQPYTIENAKWWINLQLSGSSNLQLQALRAGDPETGTFIGSVSLMPADSEALAVTKEIVTDLITGPGKNEHELGYYLHPDFRGKGIMRNAVRALIAWGKEEKGANDVIVKVEEGNLASRGVIERMSEFVRLDERTERVDWPESKGGGNRKVLVWKWKSE
jgi:RimJ/RimL family protein N-acetyltransferase